MKNRSKNLLPDIAGISERTQCVLSCFKRTGSACEGQIIKAMGDKDMALSQIETLLATKYPMIQQNQKGRLALTQFGQVFMFPHLFLSGEINNLCGFMPLHGPSVISALRTLVNLITKQQQPSVKQLYEAVGAPDFGTPTEIIGKSYLQGYETGVATITVQGLSETVKGSDGRKFVVIKSTPPGITMTDLYQSIQDKVTYRTRLMYQKDVKEIWIGTTDVNVTMSELINFTDFRRQLTVNHRLVDNDGNLQESIPLIQLMTQYLENLYQHVELLIRQQSGDDTGEVDTTAVLDGMDQYLAGLLPLIGETERQTTVNTSRNVYYLPIANHEGQDWIVTLSGNQLEVRGLRCEVSELEEDSKCITCNSRDSIVFITDTGYYKLIAVKKLKVGQSLLSDIAAELNGKVIQIIRLRYGETRQLCVITKFGYSKLTNIGHLGSRLILLRDNDCVGAVCWVKPNTEVLIIRESGRGFRLSTNNIPEFKSQYTSGYITAKKMLDDPVVDIIGIDSEKDYVFILCRNNYKMLQMSDVPIYKPGAEGCKIAGKNCTQLCKYEPTGADLKIVSTKSSFMIKPEHLDIPIRRGHGTYSYTPLITALEIPTSE